MYYRRTLLATTIAGAIALGASPMAMADTADDIISALIGKGILSAEEGALLMQNRASERKVAEKALAEKKANEISTTFKDGIAWESGDKAFKISLNGRVQADYRSFSNPDAQNADTFDLRRIYFGATGTFYDTVDFTVNANFADSPQLLDAWLNLRYWDKAQLKIGQYKMPIGLEELTSSRFINFQERSLAMNLVPGYDRGIQLHGTPTKGTTYAVAISNGNLGANTLQNKTEPDKANDGKDVTGRFTANIAELMGIKDTVIHLGAAFSRGEVDGDGGTVKLRTEGRGATFLETNAFKKGDKIKTDRNALELSLSSGPVKFTSEYVNIGYDGKVNGVDGNREIDSWYAAVNWNIIGESYAPTYKGGKFGSRLKPKQNFRPGSGGWGAWEVGLRYSELDGSDFAGQVKAASSATKASAWTAGLKWIVNPHTRFLLNYVSTDFDGVKVGGEDSEKAITLRGQFDF